MKELPSGRLSLLAGMRIFQYLTLPLVAATLLVLSLATTTSRAEKGFSVVFLNPTIESYSPFFELIENVLKATAADLNIDLHIAYGKNNYMRMRQSGLDLMETVKPDYFLTGYYIGATNYHLEYTQNNQTKLLLFVSPPTVDLAKEIKPPRVKYPNFVGQLTPHDKEFGYKEADVLIAAARNLKLAGKDEPVNIIAFGGFDDDYASEQRLSGLKQRAEEGRDAVVLKTMLAGWNRNLSYKYTLEMLRENPSIHAIWSTNDDMAGGCIQAAEEAGRHPGKDILIGGIDLSKKAIDDIENGKQAVSVGGQFMEAAWSLAMLYDYHHGIDFNDSSHYIFHSKAHAVTKDNAAAFRKYFLPADWNSVDFRLLTKTHNPKLKEYDFSLEAMQKILAQKEK